MPPGLNFLFRLSRKVLAEPLEDTGLLPGKYYRSQALQSLEDNDFPACLRYLGMAYPHRKAQARMVAQLLVLRCRMLCSEHERRLAGLEARWRLEGDPGRAERYERIIGAERQALQLLGRYIRAAQKLMQNPAPPTPSPGESSAA